MPTANPATNPHANPQAIRADGDTLNHGQIMLSFSLPLAFGEEAKEAGRQLCRQMGLEAPQAYHALEVRNLGAQVDNERLLAEARDFAADVVLVSQIVTQKDCHRSNLAALIDLAEADGVPTSCCLCAEVRG
jgi:hypothetical protein